MKALKDHYTREEYLAFDDASPEKHQFYNGEIFAMSGGSFNHALIGTNATHQLQARLAGSPCQTMNSDMRVTTPSGLNTYPDASIYCGDPELTDNSHTLLNPVLIVEVLSPSTRNYDQGDKFTHYRSIPCLQDYLLIESEFVHIAHYQRQGKHEWLLREYDSLEDELNLSSVKLQVTVATFYDNVKFD
ncbi:Uma2 family endonuclease [Leucothrix pacifica]|uniref:Uma2 family endonuclease n=1 Tax=Leucothrix pacifica TaxID=1247513 RepID=A0A317CEW9_9GAMM|nr:Uma2 family endonuclease [Leucothrix pacifica]PWQ97128.1 Uma2 family endonuclease [Leucothrix pacifica]